MSILMAILYAIGTSIVGFIALLAVFFVTYLFVEYFKVLFLLALLFFLLLGLGGLILGLW